MSHNTAPALSLSDIPQAAIADASPATPGGPPGEIRFDARKSVTFRCGKSSPTLHASGKTTPEADHIHLTGERTVRIAGGRIGPN